MSNVVQGAVPQKATIGGLSAVLDIDTWGTAGDMNCGYQRGDYFSTVGWLYPRTIPRVKVDSQQRKPTKNIRSAPTFVLDIDTWGTAGDMNCGYQRGDYLQCCGDSQM
jgi:hypothetical protein